MEKNSGDVAEIVELVASHVHHTKLREKLSVYRDVFAHQKNTLGTAIGSEQYIDINDNPPFEIASYRVAPYKLPAVQGEIKEMLDIGVLVRSKSSFSSTIVIVPKKDGLNRRCIDYRELTETTTKDAYPLPRICQTNDALQGIGSLSSLNLASGYWQKPVAGKNCRKIAFCIPESDLYVLIKSVV